MPRMKALMVLFLFLAFLLTSCAGSPDYPETSVSVRPKEARVLAGETVQFSVTVLNAADRRVTWTVSGTGCLGDSCGTISGDGLYTAPVSVPGRIVVTVRAASNADPTKSASATITVNEPDVIEWTWIAGSDLGNSPGEMGTKGVPSPSNVPPPRRYAGSWLGPDDSLWLFGGEGLEVDGHRNDLWKFDPVTLEWTWVSGSAGIDQLGVYGIKGTSDPANVPGGRFYPFVWSDPKGNLWLFGGIGRDSTGVVGAFNDLWVFDVNTLEWTWISGSSEMNQPGIYGTKGVPDPLNVPGGRSRGGSWFDAHGDLWLFGGGGIDSEGHGTLLNDLWKFDTATLEWTWVSGSPVGSQFGTYGTRNVPSPSNVPGGRQWAVSGIDPAGRFWLYGGDGYDSGLGAWTLSDLWRFDPATTQWTWVSGSDKAGQPGLWGTKYLPDPANVPGARMEPALWIDAEGVLWLFGGDGFDALYYQHVLNDLWEFDPVRLEWVWVSGNDSPGVFVLPGIYGTRGQADPLNMPGARYSALSWYDSQGRFWLFGGMGMDSGREPPSGGLLNDLWRFERKNYPASIRPSAQRGRTR